MTASTATVRSIRCTHCGAPLKLHGGGHKIRTLNCSYCGAIMDVRENYALLARFTEQQPPYCPPFKLGQQGKIKGIDFIIIGMVAWEDSDYPADYNWVDMLLFSNTHGYAWLTYNRGHLLFSHRTRNLPDCNLWQLSPRTKFKVGSQQYQMYEKSRARIHAVIGELTWFAQVGDSIEMIEAIAPPYFFEFSRSETESEYYQGEYLDAAKVHQDFGLEAPNHKPQSQHPAQPYKSRFLQPLSQAARPFALVAAVIAAIIWLFFTGSPVYQTTIGANELKEGKWTERFQIDHPKQLVELEMSSNLSNAWSYIEVQLIPNNKSEPPVYSFGKNISFYEGKDSDGYWTEGSRTATAHFLVPAAGQYVLGIQQVEGGIQDSTMPPNTQLTISIRQAYVSPFYFVILLIISLIASLAGPFAKSIFEERRWQAVLEDD